MRTKVSQVGTAFISLNNRRREGCWELRRKQVKLHTWDEEGIGVLREEHILRICLFSVEGNFRGGLHQNIHQLLSHVLSHASLSDEHIVGFGIIFLPSLSISQICLALIGCFVIYSPTSFVFGFGTNGTTGSIFLNRVF